MNCKPGDLAVIVRTSNHNLIDRIVTVLYAAPVGQRFRLPDGYLHFEVPASYWVCEFANPVDANVGLGGEAIETRSTKFAPVPDWNLRPIRDPGADAVDETLQRLPAPREAVPA